MKTIRMSKFTLCFLVVLAVLAAACSSQPLGQASAAQPPAPEVITVTGAGTARGEPDMATVSLGVTVSDARISAAVESSNETIDQITQELVALGVPEANIQTSNFNIWPEDVFDRQTGQNTGERIYHVDSTLQVRIEGTDMVGQVLQTAVENGANNVYGLTFGLQDTSGMAEEARASAIDDARGRAGQIAQALEVELGEVLSATEISGGQVISVVEAEARGIGGGGGEPPISEGQLAVNVMMEISFRIVR